MISLTNSEKRALIIVISVIFLSILIQWILPHEVRSDLYDYTYQDSLFTAASRDTVQNKTYQEKSSEEKKQKDNKKAEIKKKTSALKPFNINTATYDQLIQLPGIGKVTANEILNYQKEFGPFRTLEELKKVKRIGPKTLEKIRPFIYLSNDSTKTKH
ncbi:MAG: helix-hairpin-helix domain-containing protein [Calditrichaceae bacterium]|nr:helix-hairpin-helix domain-containing protein [Calditrichaceae bacterium]MBN2710448.1 helix-hairpin-helix domain-containing protein [Calditrichaceae bacterium]RQV93616.1 MAG: helix-hairpin-helix domain-containing protein [Calditrichota bacterium]